MHPVGSWNQDECQPMNEFGMIFGPKEGHTVWNVHTLHGEHESYNLSESRFHITLIEIMDASNPKVPRQYTRYIVHVHSMKWFLMSKITIQSAKRSAYWP